MSAPRAQRRTIVTDELVTETAGTVSLPFHPEHEPCPDTVSAPRRFRNTSESDVSEVRTASGSAYDAITKASTSTCMRSERPFACTLCKRHFPFLHNYQACRCHTCDIMFGLVARAVFHVQGGAKSEDSDDSDDDEVAHGYVRDPREQYKRDYCTAARDPEQFHYDSDFSDW